VERGGDCSRDGQEEASKLQRSAVHIARIRYHKRIKEPFLVAVPPQYMRIVDVTDKVTGVSVYLLSFW
jgi:hypothetical protein